MKHLTLPSRDVLEKHAELIPEINPSEVIAMLQILQAANEVHHAILDVLERDYQLSEGKLCVMIWLHQHPEGVAPSYLAEQTGVTRATISAMLRRMLRDNLVYTMSDTNDGRAKKICLTSTGRDFMNKILPAHYLRITRLMRQLSEPEQEELIRLLKKIIDG